MLFRSARYGAATVTSIFRTLLDRSEAMTRAALRRLPEGTFRYTDWLDNDGVDLDARVRIEVAVTLRDGSIHFDFTGTDPQESTASWYRSRSKASPCSRWISWRSR